jgi:hypothetical protein
MTRKEQLDIRRQQWEAFNRWESENPAPAREPAEILADLGTIWNWMPPEVRAEDPDPQKLGIQRMRSALAHLRP